MREDKDARESNEGSSQTGTDLVGSAGGNLEFPRALAGLLLPGRGLRSYKLVLKDDRLVQLVALDAEESGPPGWLTMSQAASRLSHGYHWLSRSWRGLGLRPRQIGRVLMFSEQELADYIARQHVKARGGRKRKVVGIEDAQR